MTAAKNRMRGHVERAISVRECSAIRADRRGAERARPFSLIAPGARRAARGPVQRPDPAAQPHAGLYPYPSRRPAGAPQAQILAAASGLIRGLTAMEGVTVGEVMERSVRTVPRGAALAHIARALLDSPGPLFVTGDGGALVGAITARSFLAALAALEALKNAQA